GVLQAIEQITETADDEGDAQKFGEIAGPEDKKAQNAEVKAEEDAPDEDTILMGFDEEQGERLQLLGGKARMHGTAKTAKEDERQEVDQRVDSHHCHHHQASDHGSERQRWAHRLEQDEQHDTQDDLGQHDNDVS